MYTLAHISRIMKPITETAAGLPLFSIVEGQLVEVCNQGICMVSRIALGDRPDDWEGVENIDDVQHCADRQGRTYQRHGNLEELLPIAGSVYRSRFIIACVNTCRPERTQNVTNGIVTKIPQAISHVKYAPAVGVQFMALSMIPRRSSRVFSVP